MRYLVLLLSFLFPFSAAVAQKILAQDDHRQPRPFITAYEQKADFIEADVWLQNDKLVISSTKPQPGTPAPTLDSLYLSPIRRLFAQHDGYVSPDRRYTFGLVLDVKDNQEAVLTALVDQLQQNVMLFNRTANPNAVQIIISGNRPKIESFLDQSALLQFDGRPSEIYDEETLVKVAMISDNFDSYSQWNGEGKMPEADQDKLKRVLKRAHSSNKPFRLSNVPPNANALKQLKKLGVDIIGTDKVSEVMKEGK
ncbi:glycerophosphodiester phosphodiesterase [Spirosoma sp. KUDC1026]|uniref:glycerophosphodiester phosphodiesterase n=1 Tax=Spirosoma sp. KUDC1026 TaxID=2745947 RepID=UPI00159BBF29|nr:glycerophosphodiester phosphodiesterase [Spirosoma sp. KUDC1026]QKZ13099.1 glycerophosphodiester phosphodiesterase [Spirosoma sp. KUDC1026]